MSAVTDSSLGYVTVIFVAYVLEKSPVGGSCLSSPTTTACSPRKKCAQRVHGLHPG